MRYSITYFVADKWKRYGDSENKTTAKASLFRQSFLCLLLFLLNFLFIYVFIG